MEAHEILREYSQIRVLPQQRKALRVLPRQKRAPQVPRRKSRAQVLRQQWLMMMEAVSPPSLEGGPPGLEPGKRPTPTGKGNSASLGHTVLFTGASPHEEHVDLSGTIMETKLYFPTAIRVQRYLPTSSRYEEQYEQYTEEIFIIRDDKLKLDNDQQPRADTRVDVTRTYASRKIARRNGIWNQ